MAVKIRLKQTGSKNRRLYRVVAVDEHKKRDGGVIENLGFINQLVKPTEIKVDQERLTYWQSKGAKLTEGAARLLKSA